MATEIPYEKLKLSGFGCKLPLYLAVYAVALFGLTTSILILVGSFTILVCVSTQENWTTLPVMEVFYAEITEIGDRLVKLNITDTNTEENRKIGILGLTAVVILGSASLLTYFILLLKRIKINTRDAVAPLIKFASYACAVGRIIFCFQYGVGYIFNLLEGEGDKFMLQYLFVGMSLIIAVPDIIMASLVIHALRKNKNGLVKFFLLYMIGVFVVRLFIYCFIIIWGKDKIFSVYSLVTHVLTFSGSYSFFTLCDSCMVLESPVPQPPAEKNPDEPEYEGDYAAIECMESIRLERPEISGQGAKILNIHATVSGWLEVDGSRHWALIFEGTLYLYNTPVSHTPVRTFRLNNNRKITKKKSIYLQMKSEKIQVNVLVDDDRKIDGKIMQWNKAIDDCNTITKSSKL